MITEDEQMCENCEERAATHLKRGVRLSGTYWTGGPRKIVSSEEELWLCNECDPELKARKDLP